MFANGTKLDTGEKPILRHIPEANLNNHPNQSEANLNNHPNQPEANLNNHPNQSEANLNNHSNQSEANLSDQQGVIPTKAKCYRKPRLTCLLSLLVWSQPSGFNINC